mgnify:CR=1 FL=1
MYLFERIVGVMTYMSVMLIMVYLIYKSPKEKLKKYLIIYNILLFVMAFFYIPATSADLYRLTKTMNYYSGFALSELPKLLSNNNAPVQILYFYIIGKLGIDNLLPAITSFIFYGNVFIIIYKNSKRFNLSNKSIAISLFFFMVMGKFVEVISGIRTMLAFSIIALCCYNEILEKRSFIKDIIFYLIASLIHPAAMILTFIRIIFLLFQKENKIIKKISNIIVFTVLIIFIVTYGKTYMQYALNKANTYINGNVYSYVWEYVISWLYIVFSTYSMILGKKYLNKNIEIAGMRLFIIYINIIIICFSFEYSIFSRFQAFSSILFVPIFSIILNQVLEEHTDKNKRYMIMFCVISALIFFIIGIRGNLSGYKYILFT